MDTDTRKRLRLIFLSSQKSGFDLVSIEVKPSSAQGPSHISPGPEPLQGKWWKIPGVGRRGSEWHSAGMGMPWAQPNLSCSFVNCNL